MKTNKRIITPKAKTHEGAIADRGSTLSEFRRTLSTCLLFENTFYEGGKSIAARLMELAAKLPADQLIAETLRAKHELHLRHAPLWTARALTKHHQGSGVGKTIASVITRADDLAEFLSLYWKDGRTPLSKQVKLGLAEAIGKFDEYQLAKYNRDGAVKLRDVVFLTHPTAKDGYSGYMVAPISKKNYKRGEVARTKNSLLEKIVNGTLSIPDTWEVAISACKNDAEKKAEWTRLLENDKIGDLALLRNLRNLDKLGVDRALVIRSLNSMTGRRILPYQYTAAWRYAPTYARQIEDAMMRSFTTLDKMQGTTVILVDVSSSMHAPLSDKSDMNRMDAAATLATHVSNTSEDARVFTFSSELVEVRADRGFGLISGIVNSQPHSNTYLGAALKSMEQAGVFKSCDRLIVVTDEQSKDPIPDIKVKNKYLINVAPYQYGVRKDKTWKHIDGFSQAVVDWILQEESEPQWDEA